MLDLGALHGSAIWPSSLSNPIPDYGQAGFFDPASSRLLVQGGATFGSAWSPSTISVTPWSPFQGNRQPPYRHSHSISYDAARRRLVSFGGGATSYLNAVWTFPLDGPNRLWTRETVTGGPPPPRRLHAAAIDVVHDRLIVFGGYDGSSRNDTWALSLSSPMAWTELVTAGMPPTPREDCSLIDDPVNDRLILFGGAEPYAPPPGRSNGLWQLSLSGTPTWSPLTASGFTPSPRSGHRAVLDPVNRRMLLFGGMDTNPESDVWALSLDGPAAWTELPTLGTPPDGRADMTVAYDVARARLLVYGG